MPFNGMETGIQVLLVSLVADSYHNHRLPEKLEPRKGIKAGEREGAKP
jgi:hypothetical protein